MHYGYEGYKKMASEIMNGVKKAGLELKKIPEIRVIGSPQVRNLKRFERSTIEIWFSVLAIIPYFGYWEYDLVTIGLLNYLTLFSYLTLNISPSSQEV